MMARRGLGGLRGAGAAALALVLAGCASSPPDNPDNACAIFAQKSGWWDAVRDAEERWGVSPAYQLAVVRQESSFEADARPPRGRFLFIFPGARPSSAYGYAQAVDPTWERYKRDTGRRFAERDSFEDAVDFIGWYVDQSRRLSRIRTDDARRQYIAYYMGHGGYNSGSWRSNSKVRRISDQVARRTARYDRQIDSCRRDLSRGLFRRFF